MVGCKLFHIAFTNFMLTQRKKLRLTSLLALLLQIVMLVSGFVLPRLFLGFYGSAVNGLISSITQFLWLVTLAECGIGAVVQSALYKPLTNKDNEELSRIVVSAEHFFRKIAKLLLLYVCALVAVYPYIVNNDFGFIFTASLIVIIAISSFAQYYFGITYRLLLNSDQLGFVPICVSILTLLLNILLSFVLVCQGASIHVVKLVSSVVFVIQPLIVFFLAHKWYKIDYSIKYDKTAIPQKWNGIAQHVSTVVLYSSGVGILTFFSTLENVSVYSVYALVVNGVRNITVSLTSGMQAFLGNLYAQGDKASFNRSFDTFELKMHLGVSLFFSITAVLIVPFVGVYTQGINDAEYFNPLFGITLTAAWAFFCIRLPYHVAVLAVGHYKQTQMSAVIEVCINICVSILGAIKFGLVGVALGTLIAMVYRTFYLTWYISKKILNRSIFAFFKLLLADLLSCFTFWGIISLYTGNEINNIFSIEVSSYLEWIKIAMLYSVLGMAVFIFWGMCFFRKRLKFY